MKRGEVRWVDFELDGAGSVLWVQVDKETGRQVDKVARHSLIR